MSTKPLTVRLAALAAIAGLSLAATTHADLTWSAEEVSRTTAPYYNNMTLPQADLSDLGPTDWVYWNIVDDAPSVLNRKAGAAVAIGPLTQSFVANKGRPGAAKIVARLNHTDGVDPVTGTNVDAGAGSNRNGWNSNSEISSNVPTFSLVVPCVTAESKVHVWFAGYKGNYVRIRAYDSENTQIGDPLDATVSTSNNGFAAFHYAFTYSGDAGTMTLRFYLTSPQQDDAFLEFQAAALDMPQPDPGTVILLR